MRVNLLAPTLGRERVSHVYSKQFSGAAQAVCPGRREAPDVTQALAKAEYNAARARSAKTDQDREYYERMGRTWLGIAQAWRVIADVGEQSEKRPPETR
jgi:hypothetical protein